MRKFKLGRRSLSAAVAAAVALNLAVPALPISAVLAPSVFLYPTQALVPFLRFGHFSLERTHLTATRLLRRMLPRTIQGTVTEERSLTEQPGRQRFSDSFFGSILDRMLWHAHSPSLHNALLGLFMRLAQGPVYPLFHSFSQTALELTIQKQWEWSRQLARQLETRGIPRPEQFMAMTQAFDWQTSADAGDIERKTVGDFYAQWNRMRSVRRQASTQNSKPIFNPTPTFFPGSVPIIGLESLGGSLRYYIANKFPLAPNHFQIIAQSVRPQFFTVLDAQAAFDVLAKSQSTALRLFFNGWGAAASINHLHIQAFEATHPMPVERYAEAEPAAVLGLVAIRQQRPEWPGRATYFSSKNQDELATVLSRFIDILQARNIPHNILFAKEVDANGHSVFHAIVMPHKPGIEIVNGQEFHLVTEIGPQDIFGPFGFMETSGEFVATSLDAYNALTPSLMRAGLQQVMLDEKTTRDVTDMLVEELDNPEAIANARGIQMDSAQILENIYSTLFPGDPTRSGVPIAEDGPIPQRLRRLMAEQPNQVADILYRLRSGSPPTLTPLPNLWKRQSSGREWTEVIDTLYERLKGLSRTRHFYDNSAPAYADRTAGAPHQNLINHHLPAFMEGLPAGRILDVGSGAGAAVKWFHDQGRDVVGMDLSEPMIHEAQTRQPTVRADAWVRGDMRDWPFAHSALAGIWSVGSLHHVRPDERTAVVSNFFDSLEMGGRAFVSVKKGSVKW